MERILPEAILVPVAKLIEQVYAYGPIADKTVVLVPSFVNVYVEGLAESIGFDVETLSYTLGMFLCYPLGMIMACLPYGKARHFFSFILGAFLLQFTLGKQWMHHVIAVVVSYALMLILPAKWTKTAVPTFIMLYCTAGHLHRQFVNYLGWDLDFTGSHMVLAMKLYSLAYNVYDGDLIKTGKETRATKKCAHLAVDGVPGFIEFLGYTFNFSTILAGPSFEYKIYADACEGKNLYDKDGKPKGKIPSQVMPTLKPFLLSLVCMVAFVVGTGKFPLLDPTDPQNFTPVVITEEFLKKPWVHRFAYSWVALFFIRMKYYFAWKNAEGASNIWYAGFEGFDENGNPKGWENSNNVDIIDFETASNVKTLSAACQFPNMLSFSKTLLTFVALVGTVGADSADEAAAASAAGLKVDVYEGPTECEDSQRVKAGNSLSMHYTGTIDQSSATGEKGSQFDSSRDRGKTFDVVIGTGQVIRGWDEGIVGLCLGAKANLVIPPEMGYGEAGAGGAIPGGATLHFDVEVVAINEGPPPEPNLFEQLDTDTDGKLSKEEVGAYFKEQGQDEVPPELWEREDTDKDGSISWAEFSGPKGDVDPAGMGDEL